MKRKAKFRVGQKARIYGAGVFHYQTERGIEGSVSENRLRRKKERKRG